MSCAQGGRAQSRLSQTTYSTALFALFVLSISRKDICSCWYVDGGVGGRRDGVDTAVTVTTTASCSSAVIVVVAAVVPRLSVRCVGSPFPRSDLGRDHVVDREGVGGGGSS